MSIYVETRVQCPLENLWEYTQDPALHERWDLRFSEIAYLPRHDDEPQRFRYETRLGFGLRIRGGGESTGTRNGVTGDRTSALKFWSNDSKSLIREGSGYWRYVPTPDGVRFLTWYDYRTRFGPFGRMIDVLFFRPLIGWATAWSFDRLRLWIEKGIDPGLSMQRSLVHATARVALAFVFLYQGLLPKLIYRHASEFSMLTDAGLHPDTASRMLTVIGVMEVALGAAIMTMWRAQWPFAVIVLLMPVALIGVATASPHVLIAAFNPVALNIAVAALAAVAWLTSVDLPSASRCLRTRPAERSMESP
jgi:uncharacterized protein YjeT (DUF2065 family)